MFAGLAVGLIGCRPRLDSRRPDDATRKIAVEVLFEIVSFRQGNEGSLPRLLLGEISEGTGNIERGGATFRYSYSPAADIVFVISQDGIDQEYYIDKNLTMNAR
jgi:hypothetical protein